MDSSQLTSEAKKNMRNAVRRRVAFYKRIDASQQKYVIHAGKYSMALNQNFLKNNKAEDNLELLKDLFKKKFKLFSRMERSTKKETIMKLAEEVKLNEFEIQKAFNFKPNTNYFRFWEMPKCRCPHMDNQERWGLDFGFIHTGDCPIHGSHTWKK